jgi:predicted nuclease of predicted toxin-antitoxin system
MRILVDENIPRMTVQTLRSLGHDVSDVRGTLSEGMADAALWEIAQGERRVLITTDKGFARHWDRQPNRLKIHERVMRDLTRFRDEQWSGLLVVMRDAIQSVSRAKP